MENMQQTPSQTVGPYFAYGLTPGQYLYDFKSIIDNRITTPLTSARFGTSPTLTLSGTIFDGNGQPIPDALVEIWRHDGPQQTFGRFGTGTEPDNRFAFQFEKPSALDGQAPFLTLLLFMRGQLIHSCTRIYFSDETALNATDEVLQTVPAARRHTLIAQRNESGYTFDIWMQGDNETVFFDI